MTMRSLFLSRGRAQQLGRTPLTSTAFLIADSTRAPEKVGPMNSPDHFNQRMSAEGKPFRLFSMLVAKSCRARVGIAGRRRRGSNPIRGLPSHRRHIGRDRRAGRARIRRRLFGGALTLDTGAPQP